MKYKATTISKQNQNIVAQNNIQQQIQQKNNNSFHKVVI